jgi:Fe-S oxidoreductase
MAPLSNWVTGSRPVRAMVEHLVGIDRRRALPQFERETLQRWFARREPLTPADGARRGPVVFLADSFASYTEPEDDLAAIELLEMAGWDVQLAGNVCCGRAPIPKGLLTKRGRAIAI